MNWRIDCDSISMKWSWKQKRWSRDHECTNLINILLSVPLILRLVKNLLLLLWLLEAKCELSFPPPHLSSPPLLGQPKNIKKLQGWNPESAGANVLRIIVTKAQTDSWDPPWWGVTCTPPPFFLKKPLLTFVSSAAHLFSPIPPVHLAELQHFLQGSQGAVL